MGIPREQINKKFKSLALLETPDWLRQADELPNRLYITRAENELLDLIRAGGDVTKADLVNLTDYSRTKITGCIDSLLQRKYIVENDVKEYSGGRRSKTYSINGGLALVAGVDIGATSIDFAVADLTQKILIRYSEPASVREGPLKILGRVCTLLEKMIRESGLQVDNVMGIGIGIPGPVDFSLGTVVSPPIMPGWDKYPIIQTMQQWFPHANVVVDNDVNVMALGEMNAGVGSGISDMIFVKIGTGIGSGIICQGNIYRGASGCAGDIGHISVDKNGPLCHCGNRGCLEAMTGGPAMAERAVTAAIAGKSPILMNRYLANGDKLTAEDIGHAAREGDNVSNEIIRESGQMLGDVLASLVNFYNPQMIVIGGGVSNLGNLLLSSIRQTVLNRSTPLATRNLNIVFSATGADAGVIGAVSLVMDYLFTILPSSSNGTGYED
ncbi:MAG TPA: ROK family protein [Bellilinea sp.]